MATARSITKFENSLKEFLINAMADKYGDAHSYAYRYNNLKVYMDPKREDEPHFYVQIGISEACFAILDGKKLEGGLGAEDGYVKRWSDRSNINNELKNHWKVIKEAIAAEEEEDATKKSSAITALRRAEASQTELNVDMTGTGIDKTKREELERKQKRFVGLKKDIDKNKHNNP
ncbi:MAG: hypothetical protein DK841_00765 [Candidatus Melainabacteria bacterium]|nr:MAG: hypothetical protein DK841_00765 [Candidatus Melainabacteria bacterium]